MTPFVSALLIKLTLILSLGLVVAATLRSLSPSFRHLVLYAALASSAALPFVMGVSPEWNVPLLPASISSVVNSANEHKQGPTAVFDNGNIWIDTEYSGGSLRPGEKGEAGKSKPSEH